MKNYYKNKRFKDKIILADLSCVSIWCFVLCGFFFFLFFKGGEGGGGEVGGVKQLKKD